MFLSLFFTILMWRCRTASPCVLSYSHSWMAFGRTSYQFDRSCDPRELAFQNQEEHSCNLETSLRPKRGNYLRAKNLEKKATVIASVETRWQQVHSKSYPKLCCFSRSVLESNPKKKSILSILILLKKKLEKYFKMISIYNNTKEFTIFYLCSLKCFSS